MKTHRFCPHSEGIPLTYCVGIHVITLSLLRPRVPEVPIVGKLFSIPNIVGTLLAIRFV